MDDTPVESRKGESKKNWIWVIIGLVILIAIVAWAVSLGLQTDAATSDAEVGMNGVVGVEEVVRITPASSGERAVAGPRGSATAGLTCSPEIS